MISTALLRKWKRMLRHESVFHVNQAEGAFYVPGELKGYYNDLRDKVRFTTSLDEAGVPFNIATRGEARKQVYFPISIFQYGLGAWDLWLETGEDTYREKMLTTARWARENQEASGAWDAFGCLEYSCRVSSMAQGEGASLLARAYRETGEQAYLDACLRAVEFMVRPRSQGGTAEHTAQGLELWEYPGKALVLNGWIFSAFGLYDAWLITKNPRYQQLWQEALQGIRAHLPAFDSGHWSYYDLSRKYTSPFYHQLHIQLLTALEKLQPDPVWGQYRAKWTAERDSAWWSRVAFAIKAKQKLTEKKSAEWVVTG